MPPRVRVRFAGTSCNAIPTLPLQRRAYACGAPAPQLKKRTVVGSFLFRRDEDGILRVALFKRSDKVNTNRHKYAAIAGGVEPEDASPLKAALRELHEETSLTPESLQYLCSGKPFSFVDDSSNYEFSVHPFAFQWRGAKEPIALGWEHEGHAWFQPHNIRESEVAAGMLESLRRVWPEGPLGQVDILCRYCLGEAVAKTGTDARRDAVEAFKVFVKTVQELTTNESGEWRQQARLAAWHVWNHSDRSVKGPVLTCLLPGLELLEQLLEAQHKELAPQFEKLAGMALENVAVQHMADQTVTSDSNLRYLTQEADRFFTGLWASSRDRKAI